MWKYIVGLCHIEPNDFAQRFSKALLIQADLNVSAERCESLILKALAPAKVRLLELQKKKEPKFLFNNRDNAFEFLGSYNKTKMKARIASDPKLHSSLVYKISPSDLITGFENSEYVNHYHSKRLLLTALDSIYAFHVLLTDDEEGLDFAELPSHITQWEEYEGLNGPSR